MELEGSIKTLYEDDAAVFPITSTNAVFDEDGNELSDTITDIYSKIGQGGGSSVIPNPVDEATDKLTKLKIENNTYTVGSGNVHTGEPTGIVPLRMDADSCNGVVLGIDGEGNRGYFKADGSFSPFSSGGEIGLIGSYYLSWMCNFKPSTEECTYTVSEDKIIVILISNGDGYTNKTGHHEYCKINDIDCDPVEIEETIFSENGAYLHSSAYIEKVSTGDIIKANTYFEDEGTGRPFRFVNIFTLDTLSIINKITYLNNGEYIDIDANNIKILKAVSTICGTDINDDIIDYTVSTDGLYFVIISGGNGYDLKGYQSMCTLNESDITCLSLKKDIGLQYGCAQSRIYSFGAKVGDIIKANMCYNSSSYYPSKHIIIGMVKVL